MTSKKYVISLLIVTITILILISAFVIIVDPYFHYHKPYNKITYILDNQRYQNDGIVKHFDYDAIITGTSMTENFKTTEFDELFNVKSIKVSFSGAMFKEINELLENATRYNNNIKIIVRCIDLYKINEDKDKTAYIIDDYPSYLYDDNYFNDVKYLLNKNIIYISLKYLSYSLQEIKSTSFDEYSAWYQLCNFSKEEVDNSYERLSNSKEINENNNIDFDVIRENIKQNITDLADKYPNIDFYLFYPPYSIYYWDNEKQNGTIKQHLDEIEYATKLLLEHPNIHLFSFLDEYDIITDLNNYKDIRHYSEKINSIILNKMKNNKNLITKDNYEEKIKEMKQYYMNYNYDKMFNIKDNDNNTSNNNNSVFIHLFNYLEGLKNEK